MRKRVVDSFEGRSLFPFRSRAVVRSPGSRCHERSFARLCAVCYYRAYVILAIALAVRSPFAVRVIEGYLPIKWKC